MMNRDRIGKDKRRPRGRAGAVTAALFVLSMFVLAACDSLLEVDLPGQVRSQDLNDPALAEVLVRSAQGDFECAFSHYVWAGDGLWGNTMYQTDNFSRGRLTQLRSLEVLINTQDECDTFTFPQLYLPFQIARVQGEQAVALIGGFPAGEVEDRDFLLGKAHAYTGYAMQILGETMCELVFDGGPLITREAAMAAAQAEFTAALGFVGNAASGEARAIRNMALVGRARAHLNLGNASGVLEDAGQVDAGFVQYAEMDGGNERRYNVTFDRVNRDQAASAIHPSYANLDVGGVPDPRVPTELLDIQTFDNVSEPWIQRKYDDLGDDIPFASWREAQLMIAEVSGGQTAVDVINTLRASVTDLPWVDEDPGLPAFASNDEAEIAAQVWEERRRELFLQGTKIGDILRVDIPGVTTDDFETGVNQRDNAYGPNTCYPLPDQERV